MNRQVNYIIYAMLLSLSLPLGYYFINKVVSIEVASQNQTIVTEKAERFPEPVMSKSAFLGKNLFNSKCAACHQIFKNGTGPGFLGFEERGPWNDREKLYAWVRNPAAFMKTDKYTQGLKEAYGTTMTGFPDITNEQVDAIVDYVNYAAQMRAYSSQ